MAPPGNSFDYTTNRHANCILMHPLDLSIGNKMCDAADDAGVMIPMCHPCLQATQKELHILQQMFHEKTDDPNQKFLKCKFFSHPSMKTCNLGVQKNLLIETTLLSTHNICFG